MSHTDKEFIDILAGQDLSDIEGHNEADLRIAEAALDPRLYTAVVDEYSIRVASLFIDKDNEHYGQAPIEVVFESVADVQKETKIDFPDGVL